MGTLYIVSTPIGNLKDITLRAIATLKDVDYILCEDTRVTGRLLNNFEISNKMISFNDFNEQSRIAAVIGDLDKGKNVAMVSDAGTPLISDPGYKLVRELIARGIRVESIPGPSAAIAALTVSGLPPNKFFFVGYLPKKDGKLRKLLAFLFTILQSMNDNDLKSTVIAYESPYRLSRTLKDIEGIFGDIDVVVCREVTKMYEEVLRGKASELISKFAEKAPKGEIVILF